jgi:hypothetical protein
MWQDVAWLGGSPTGVDPVEDVLLSEDDEDLKSKELAAQRGTAASSTNRYETHLAACRLTYVQKAPSIMPCQYKPKGVDCCADCCTNSC